MKHAPTRKEHAFSLVELSIVLVILGLLTGGILSGQSLIRASELRSVAADFTRYHTAVNTFRDKYMAIPGDMPNATRFWGAQDSGDGLGADCTGTASTTALTCNGNGDNSISFNVEYYEIFRFWQHLANAGLIEGTYSGVTGGGSNAHCLPSGNCAPSKISSAFFGVRHMANTANGNIVATNANTFYFGALHPSGMPIYPIIKAEEAWNIDTKLDDGKPGYGIVIGPSATGRPNCTTTDVISTSEYLLTDTTKGCNIYMVVR